GGGGVGWRAARVGWGGGGALGSFAWDTGPVSPELPTMTFTFVLVGEVCDAEAAEPAVGSEPGGGSLPVASALADALALFACPTACPFPLPVPLPLPFPLPLVLPFPLPLPTVADTFPFEGGLWSVGAPAWAFWPFELGAPFDPLA